jgi:NADPH:quinone reductase-like Zn-dependent oxidoreductase
MPFDEGAAFILTFGTSYYALENRAQLQAGETLLVLGAAGGVGLAAVELGKAMGARVIAAASSSDKVELAKAHGADAGVVYPLRLSNKNEARALTDLFKDICGESGVDVVYDAVGGAYAEAALRATNWEGRFLVVGFPAGIQQRCDPAAHFGTLSVRESARGDQLACRAKSNGEGRGRSKLNHAWRLPCSCFPDICPATNPLTKSLGRVALTPAPLRSLPTQ